MPIWGWIALGLMTALLVINVFWFNRYQMERRLSIEQYAIYLLLNDEVREDHKVKFVDWIKGAKADSLAALGMLATQAIDEMASHLAENGSVLTASMMVWEVKTQAQDGQPHQDDPPY